MAGSADRDRFRLVLLGKPGAGKSASGNTILGSKKFKCSAKFKSFTTECALEEADLGDGTTVEVLDTPGLCDTEKSDEDTAVIIARTLVGMDPGPHALIYVLKMDRFTEEEYGAFKKLETLFDQRLYTFLIVVITGGDNLEDEDETIEDVLKDAPDGLRQLLEDCKNRYIVFNNKSKDTAQADTLLRMMKGLVKTNGSESYYSCDKFRALGEELEKEIKRRIAAAEKGQLKEKKAFQDEIAQHKREMGEQACKIKEAVAKREMSVKEAMERQEANSKLLKEKEKQLRDMKDRHEKELNVENMKKLIQHDTMTSKGGFFYKSIVSVTKGALVLVAGAALATSLVVAVPVVAAAAVVAAPVIVTGALVAGAVVAVGAHGEALGMPGDVVKGAGTILKTTSSLLKNVQK